MPVATTAYSGNDFWRSGAIPPVEQLRDGVWSIPVPVPDLPIRYTLSYAFVERGRAVLVDPGWDGEASRAALAAGLAIAGVTLDSLDGVISTHPHRDHDGLVPQLKRDIPGLWFAAIPPRRRFAGVAEFRRHEEAWFERAGVPTAERSENHGLGFPTEGVLTLLAAPQPDRPVVSGDSLPVPGGALRVVATPGHTPDSFCLVDEDARILLTGDTVLPRISPNVGWFGEDGDALGDYLDSLTRLAEFDDCEVLPGHEWRFTGLKQRTIELAAHHAARLEEVEQVVADGAETFYEVARTLRWSRPWDELNGFQKRIAATEAAAHVIRLTEAGRIRSLGGDPGPRQAS